MMDAVRDALYDRLVAAALTGWGSPGPSVAIADQVDQAAKPSLPYVVVEDSNQEPWDTDTSEGGDIVTDLRVYSSYRGTAEVAKILDQIRSLLHHEALTVTGVRASCLHGNPPW
jgi:hypothetical protein